MYFLSKFTNEEVILVVPNELKNYFLELRKEEPKLKFKLLGINNLFNELRGNHLSSKVIARAYTYFPDYTYNAIKEVLEIIYHSFKIEESNNERLIALNESLKRDNLIFFNEDFSLLLKQRKILFINFEDSTLVKSLIEKLDIKNYEFIKTIDVIDTLSTSNCYRFFNIIDETHYGINEVLYEIYKKKSSENIKVILDTNRFEFYIDCFLSNVDVPFEIKGTRSLVDTKTYKFLYNNLSSDSDLVLSLLKENENDLDDEYFDDIYKTLESLDIDSLKNKKTNIFEVLSSRLLTKEDAKNAIIFKNGLHFSRNDSIYIFGLDNGYMPKAKKNNKLFSYEFRHDIGLDSLDEVNLMKSKLEQAFLKQKNIKFISYHVKDNSGRYGPSYYLDSLNIKIKETPVQRFEFDIGVAKTFFSNKADKFIKSGEKNLSLDLYYNYFKDKELKIYSNDYAGIKDYEFNNSKSFSYSSLSRYHECPFKYYLNDILKLGEFTSNTHQKFGTLAHDILIKIYDNDFDYHDEFIKKYNEMNEKEPFTKTENMLLKRYYKEVEKSVNVMLRHKKDMLFKCNHSEKSFSFNTKIEFDEFINDEIIKKSYDIKLYGRADSVIETTSGTLFIIDYKTGQEAFSKKGFLEKGTCTQLPFYYYLIRNSENMETYGKEIDGCFIKPLLINKGKFYNIFNPDENDLNSIKYGGFFYANFEAMSKFDTTLISLDPSKDKLESPYINGLKLNKKKKKGEIGLPISRKSNGPITMEEFVSFEETIKKYIANSIYGIATSKFEIAPFKTNGNDPCKFCDFKDCCLNTIGKDDEESEENSNE